MNFLMLQVMAAANVTGMELGERVMYAVQGKWEPAEYVGVDPEGKHVVCAGSSYIHLDAELVRKF